MTLINMNFIEPGATIYFSIGRIAQLEKATGKQIFKLVSEALTFEELYNALVIGMKHNKNIPNCTALFFQGKISSLIGSGEMTLQQIQEPVMKAVLATGILGKFDLDEENEEDEIEKEIEGVVERKNEVAPLPEKADE